MSASQILILVAVFAALGLVGRLLALFRQSRRIEKKLDYSKMKEWDEDEDWPSR